MRWEVELLAQSALTADLFHDLIEQEQRPVDLYQLSWQGPLFLCADTEYWLVGLLGYWLGEGWGEHTHTYTPREWLWQAGQIRFVVYCVYSGLCVCLVIGEQGRDAVWPWPEILSPIDYNLKRKADGTHCKMWQIHYLRFKIQYNKGTFKE